MLKDEENIKSDNDNIEQGNSTEESIVETKEMLEATSENTETLEKIDEVEELEGASSENIKVIKKESGFLTKLGASIIDQGISLLASFILLYLFNIILIPFGYRVGDKVLGLLVIYVIVNILYGIITEATKLKRTIGKSFLKL